MTAEEIAEAVEIAIGFVMETNYPVALRPLEIGLSEADYFSAEEQATLRTVLQDRFLMTDVSAELLVDGPALTGVDRETSCLLLVQRDLQGNQEYLIAPEGYVP